MTKRERVEDLGRLAVMLNEVLSNELFEHTASKHCFQEWQRVNHDKIEYEEPRGLEHIHMALRGIVEKLDDCHTIALGDLYDD